MGPFIRLRLRGTQPGVRMAYLELIDAVLVRQLDILESDAAPARTAHILIGRPQPRAPNEWLCAYRITGVEGILDETYQVIGIDSVQALEAAILVADGILCGSDAHREHRLFCNGRVHPRRKWFAMVEYGCEVAGRSSESVDIQVKYVELETEDDVCATISGETPQSYLNGEGDQVTWPLRRILMIRENRALSHDEEVIGFVADASASPTV